MEVTRKELLATGASAAAAASLMGLFPEHVVRALAAAGPSCGRLQDIEHVVILVQENRSFDNYFGTYPGVLGFSDPQALRQADGSSVFAQAGYPAPGFGGRLLPFRLDTQNANGECTNDITHEWGAQHRSWNGGKMDRFVEEHLRADGMANGPLTMGYYERADLAYYHALADAFTVCDRYHCSVLGPTDPNRLYTISATLDPDGRNGGPLLKTDTKGVSSKGRPFDFTWTTMPEQLRARGVSWKVYAGPDGNAGDNLLLDFTKFRNDPQLAANAFAPTFPGTFQADAAAGTLPQVSWVLAPLAQTEHPPAAPVLGEYATSQVLSALTANQAVWTKTALFVTWDENGGFFDHVPPPVAPPGTPGEFVGVDPLPAVAEGIRGPIGLGFRVPLLVISPFARGGFVCSDVFDHTSLLRFLETRFGAEVPNLTPWRRSVTGDLTSAFNFVRPDDSVPVIAQPSPVDPAITRSNCATNSGPSLLDENSPIVATYPVPPNRMPVQAAGVARRPSGLCGAAAPGSTRRASKPKRHRKRLRRHRRRHRRARHRFGPRFSG
ncbi:MAG: phospholipase C [Thermoleophilaceae bacterium]